jgi:hypothetical protein
MYGGESYKEIIIKRWDETCITRVFKLALYLVAMEVNTTTPLFKQTTNVEEVGC